ncbi:MAG: PDZ domain-containing protein, partial [Porticoccaceae bacterium]|nr:PDZ domain-containing protein [Porticoccaceae bacterium]
RLYTVSVDGTPPQPLPLKRAGAGAFSPDGKRVLFTPHARDFRTWYGYQGGWAQELWIYNLESGHSTNLSQHKGTDRHPIWSRKGIHFVSERDGHLNLYSINDDGTGIRQLTRHEEHIGYAGGDADGNVVYEVLGQLRVYRDGSDHALSVQLPTDDVATQPRVVQVGDEVGDTQLSPDGQYLAVEARGDIFTLPVDKDKGVTYNLTQSDNHDRLPTWSADGKTVAYVSDASGEEEIWLADARSRRAPKPLTSGNQLRFYRLEWSPGGDYLAVGDKDGKLYAVSRKSGKLRLVGEMGAFSEQDFSWSHDGRYLAYVALEENFLRSIHIWDSKSGKDHLLTTGSTNDFSPAWAPSGNYLYFLGDRSYAPQRGAREWNYILNRETVVLGVALQDGLQNPFDASAEDNSNGGSGPASGIEFSGLSKRIFRVPLTADNYRSVAVAENNLVLYNQGAPYFGRDNTPTGQLLRFSLTDQKLHTITEVADDVYFSLAAGQASLAVNNDHQLSVYSLDGTAGQTVDTAGLQKRIDPRAEWRTVFDETWRRFRDFFYVDNMHGFDWQGIGEKYRKRLPGLAHRADLNNLMGRMISELNIGHAYVYGGDGLHTKRPKAALLGARFAFDRKAGEFQITDILAGDNSEKRYRSPLTEVGVDVQVGDYLLAVNGIKLNTYRNPFELLRTMGGQDSVELTVRNRRGKIRHVAVAPIASENNLLYLQQVEANSRKVAELSGGRLGYIHIPDMAGTGLQEFIKRFYPQIRRDGLVVDVRGNLGSNASQMIIERLLRPAYSYGYVQGERHSRIYPWGDEGMKVFTGDIIVLADETTLSDGEAFTWTFQQSGKGKVVGVRTWGGTVGTGETGVVVDGGGMRVPQYPLADLEGNWVVEGTGVIPDIEVANDPS